MRWLALFLLFAQPVSAQELAVDEASVIACFEGAPTGETAPVCLGAASNGCQNAPGGSTTIGIVDCIALETQVWDRILNEEYGTTRAYLKAQDADLKDALLTAQRAWIAFRDAECALSFERWKGGTIRSIVYANCVMVFTSERALQLRDMREGRP